MLRRLPAPVVCVFRYARDAFAERAITLFLSPRIFTTFAFCIIGVFLTLLALAVYPGGTAMAASGQQDLARTSQPKPLPLADRVAHQRAIEEVYWRHRIWQRGRPDSKPPLDQVMSPAQVEQKVEGYLRNSEALEEYWQQPIRAEQLQAEMERMAQHTQQPEVLRELFAALGNDPFLIAECLARPALSQRLITNFDANSQEFHRGLRQRSEAGLSARAKNQKGTTMAALTADYTLPTISVTVNGFTEETRTASNTSDEPTFTPGCTDDTWTATSSTNAPTDRERYTAVWTGSEVIVWGGRNSGNMYLNTGGRYNPATDTWTATNTTNAPIARFSHTAIWTGSEMIVWGGGAGAESGYYLNTGGRYNPGTDSWTATSITNAPAGRDLHTAVWTGSEMIVWAGLTLFTGPTDTGGRYDPSTDSWTTTTTDNAPPYRYLHTAVWTGSEMIVWAGYAGGIANTGARYNPAKDSWTATSPNNAPTARERHTAVWTGWEMIVWGGNDDGSSLNTGGKYNPSTDSWTATSTNNAPTARYVHTAVSVGSEMMVWGGYDGASYLSTGARYSPSTDSWAPTSTTNAPTGRAYYAPVWTGSEVIVWGGNDGISSLNTGGRYCAQAPEIPTPTPITPTPVPTATPAPPCTYRVLIVYADNAPPAQLQAALLAEPGIASVDLFEAVGVPPTLGQLQNYDIVVPLRNDYTGFAGTTTIGNNLANYLDGGGIVVQVGLSFIGPDPQGGINGRWLNGGYSPYVYSHSYTDFTTTTTLGTFVPGHPLMEGVTFLQSNYHNVVTLAAGAVQVAAWNNGASLVAYQTVGGRITVGVTAYIGCHATWGGAFPRIIANAGRWLKPGGCPIPTPTPIPTPLPTTTPTPLPTLTPSTTPTSTQTPSPTPTVNISGTISYCSNPIPGPVTGVTLTLTGTSGGSTLSDGSGTYQFSLLTAGESYTVTPTKAARTPGSSGINTLDVIAVQKHFLGFALIPPGCRLAAANVVPPAAIDTLDVIAIQHFFLGQTAGIGDTGKYQFSPANRSYSPLSSNQSGQDYDAIILGDCVGPLLTPP